MTVSDRSAQPGLTECAFKWWPVVIGAMVVTLALLAAYLLAGGARGLGAAAAERRRAAAADPPPQPEPAEPIGTYTTHFKPGEPRVRNIVLAARALDGRVVKAGGKFSFNDVVGPRSKRRGYVPAPSILGARLVDDLGGGICQVSTTLFNAVFEAGMQIRRSRAHTLWMPEYPRGREAAVAYPGLDFVWRNDTAKPVTIRAELTATTLTVSLWGERRYGVRARTSRPYAFTSFGSATGRGRRCVPSRGGRGFQIDVWRILERGGREVRRERFHTVYQPQEKVDCA
ncbi:VanW family protein [Actinomadura macrotermitis]|uniref:VanW family protein n=1 Tax=Actinomadura macrotermitis TaxID=2585200 RepID=A0A7K0BU64_9ACTN|nr:VanW family protein [Actinomadura macrotermitis]MQY04234.1 hypothetical protein [Actinomadura macrotermitis]